MLTSNFNIIPPVIAHRGASAYAPENTMPAFLKAKQLGAKWLEFDVQLTKDNELVIFHDDELDRTSNGSGYLWEHTLAELKALDVGRWYTKDFAGTKILTLSEVLSFLQKENMAANIEIKAREGDEKFMAEKVVPLIQNFFNQNPFPFLVSSFNPTALSAIRKLTLDFPLGTLMDQWHPEWQMICESLNCISVNVNHEILTRERCQEIIRTNRRLLAYTVNEVDRAHELFSWGVHAVFSDCPDKILLV